MLSQVAQDTIKACRKASAGKRDKLVGAHLYNWQGWHWYVTEYSKSSGIGFAYVSGFEDECGSVYIPELMDKNLGWNGIAKEEPGWKPCRLSELAGLGYKGYLPAPDKTPAKL